MKFLILSTLFLSVSTTNQEARTGRSIDADENRRDGVSYSTNVVHIDPKYPDQQALSSIDFKSGSDTNIELTSQKPYQTNQHSTNQQSTNKHIFQYTTPKSIQDYSQDYRHGGGKIQHYQKPYSQPEAQPHQAQHDAYPTRQTHLPPHLQGSHVVHHQKHQIQHSTPQKYVQKPQSSSNGVGYPPSPQSQSFNVGYSVKFMNGAAGGIGHEQRPKYKAPRLEADIITGSPKETVSKPQQHYQPDELNHNLFLDAKKQKLSGIKTKYTKLHAPATNTKHIIAQANFTPETQKHLAYLDAATASNKFQKEFEQQALAGQANSSPWENLSPSVEIYRSKEIDLQQPQQSRDSYNTVSGFDHQKALGKSVGFDYTNAVDFNNLQNGQLQQFTQQTAQLYEQNQNQYNGQPQALNLFAPATNNYHKDASGSVPKLPIDMSLLRDPIITIDKKPIDNNSKTIPIHFDTTLIQEMGKQYGNLFDEVQSDPRPQQGPYINRQFAGPQNNYDASKTPALNHQLNLQQFNTLLGESSKHVPQTVEPNYPQYVQTQEPLGMFLQKPKQYESQQADVNEMKFGYPQNGLFNPALHKSIQPEPYRFQKQAFVPNQKPKMYMVNENIQESKEPQQQTQFKVFGKPQNNFMRHEFEKFQKIKTPTARYPRFNPKRILTRDYNLHGNSGLLPPPNRPMRLRRMHMGY